MIRVNISELKMHLSRYLNHLGEGETMILCKRNKPIGEIRLLPQPMKARRPLGLDKGKVKLRKEFFDPLPQDLLDLFEGKG